jgi:hypothetical protein
VVAGRMALDEATTALRQSTLRVFGIRPDGADGR